ncbi:uncharacterized protein LOC144431345 [Styela clava]
MVLEEDCQQASISLKEYIDFFLQTQSNATTPTGGKLVVKCNLVHAGILRFSKVFRGGENKGENAELQLAKELRVLLADDKYWPRGPCELQVISNKSPSIISADHFAQVLRSLRGKLGGGSPVIFNISYAHPCHYVNQRALTNLHRAGIKLSVLRVEDIISEAIQDAITEVKGLASIACQKLRGLKIQVDTMMLASAQFMLTKAFEVDGVTVSERLRKSNYTDDIYVQKLKQELKKLQGSSRTKIQKRQNTIERGRRSSSFDPYSEKREKPDLTDSPSKTTKIPRKPLKTHDEIPWQTSMYLRDKTCAAMRQRSGIVLHSVENGEQEISLGMDMYRMDYILNGGPNKSSKMKAIDGKWTLQCFTKDLNMFYQEQGLVLKNAYDDSSDGLTNPQLYKNMIDLLNNTGENDISVEIEILLTSLPDKNNFLRQSLQFADKLSQRKEIENIILVGYFAGLDAFTMPSKQGLRKMLRIGENTKNSKIAAAVKPLHLQNILKFMMNDLLVALANIHLIEETRGVKIRALIDELSASMHLIRSSVKLSNHSGVGPITDESITERLTDKHCKACESQLDNILSTVSTRG